MGCALAPWIYHGQGIVWAAVLIWVAAVALVGIFVRDVETIWLAVVNFSLSVSQAFYPDSCSLRKKIHFQDTIWFTVVLSNLPVAAGSRCHFHESFWACVKSLSKLELQCTRSLKLARSLPEYQLKDSYQNLDYKSDTQLRLENVYDSMMWNFALGSWVVQSTIYQTGSKAATRLAMGYLCNSFWRKSCALWILSQQTCEHGN